jgi:hypothetical protein
MPLYGAARDMGDERTGHMGYTFRFLQAGVWMPWKAGSDRRLPLVLSFCGKTFASTSNVEGQARHGRKNLLYRRELETPTGCLSKAQRITHNFLVRV